MHTGIMRLDRIGVPVRVSAVVVVVLLAAAVWLQPWNSGTDQFPLWKTGTDQSILQVGSVAYIPGGEPLEAADSPVGPDLDKNWCENADGHYPQGQPVVNVFYGLPKTDGFVVDPPPGHPFQVKQIVCTEDVLENSYPGMKGTVVWDVARHGGEEGEK